MLELRSDYLCLGYVAARLADINTNAPRVIADLPVNFRALWLRTSCICVKYNKHSGGASVTDDDELVALYVAGELCHLLSLAPASYKEFRLFARATHPTLAIHAQYDETLDVIDFIYDDLPAVRDAMHQVADAQGLAVSLSEGAAYLRVDRIRPRRVSR